MKKLISTDKAGLRSPYEGPDKDLDIAIVDVQEETGIRYGKPQVLSSAEFNEAYANADEDVKELIEAGGGGLTPEHLSVTPSTEAATYTPDTGKYYDQVNVSAVTSSIDENIDPANIKEGVTILGVTGTYVGGGVIERRVLDRVPILDGDANIVITYEYAEPSDWEAPGSPNHKEIYYSIENTSEEELNLTGYIGTLLSQVTGDDSVNYSTPFNLSIGYLQPGAVYKLNNLVYVQEPAEGESDPQWDDLNTFVEEYPESGNTTVRIANTSDAVATDTLTIPNDDVTYDMTISLVPIIEDDQIVDLLDYRTFSWTGQGEPTYQSVEPYDHIIAYDSENDYELNHLDYAASWETYITSCPSEMLSLTAQELAALQFRIEEAQIPTVSSIVGEYWPAETNPYQVKVTFEEDITLVDPTNLSLAWIGNGQGDGANPVAVSIDAGAPNRLILEFALPDPDWISGNQIIFQLFEGTIMDATTSELLPSTYQITDLEFSTPQL